MSVSVSSAVAPAPGGAVPPWEWTPTGTDTPGTHCYAIPLQQGTPQQFVITLGSVTYQFTLQYRNDPGGAGGWVLDIADSFGNAIAQGLPLVTGANLLDQYGYLDIGNECGLWVQTTDDPDAVPTFDDLGISGQLYVVTP